MLVPSTLAEAGVTARASSDCSRASRWRLTNTWSRRPEVHSLKHSEMRGLLRPSSQDILQSEFGAVPLPLPGTQQFYNRCRTFEADPNKHSRQQNTVGTDCNRYRCAEFRRACSQESESRDSRPSLRLLMANTSSRRSRACKPLEPADKA